MKRTRWIAFTVPLFVILAGVGTVAKAVHNWFSDPGHAPTESIANSISNGLLISVGEAKPGAIETEGKQVVIKEVWIEQQSDRGHYLVWFPYLQRRGGYFLCVVLGADLIQNYPYFVGDRASFRMSGTTPLAWKEIPQPIESTNIVFGLKSQQEVTLRFEGVGSHNE